MRILPLAGLYAIARLEAGDAVPEWPRGAFLSITRTEEELSIVCDESSVPDGVRSDRGWRCLVVKGPIPFETVGVAASIAAPLAAAGISLFLVATFDTDYVLVKQETYERACLALRDAGHDVGIRRDLKGT